MIWDDFIYTLIINSLYFEMKNRFLIFIKFIIVFSIIVGYTACSKSKTNTVLEADQVDSLENVYNTCDSLQEILNQKPDSISVNEYGRKLEHAMCEKAKQMRGLSNEDKLLLEYDAAKKLLENISKKGKINPELYKNPEFIKNANVKMDKVREFYNQLKKADLNSDQQKRFDEITRRKI